MAFIYIYIYWSALSHTLNNRKTLTKTLKIIWNDPKLLDTFTAGLFDADGYFILRHKKPDRIGIEQSKKKWWFPLFCKILGQRYLVKIRERTRKYKIIQRHKVYEGINTHIIVNFRRTSWLSFIDNIVLAYCKKPRHLKRASKFKDYAIKV